MSDTIKTIDNAFDIIDLLDKNEEMGVGEISNILNLPKTSVHRILKTLSNRQMVIQNESERYSLGYGMYKYAKGINKHNLLVNIARKPMQEFAKLTGETLNLGVLVGEEVIIIHSEEGEYYSLQPMLSSSSDLNCSGMGKIFLSQFTASSLAHYFDREFKQRTINTITSQSEYEIEKSSILKNQIAFDNEEYEYGLSCIATAIYDSNGSIIAAISISGPTSRLQYKEVDHLGEELMKAASRINERITDSK